MMTAFNTRSGSRAPLSASLNEAGDEPNINLMPLIDVVLIVLIFFITTTSFIPPSDATKSVEIRRAATADETPPQNDNLRVVLTADNTIRFNDASYTPATLGELFAARRTEQAELSVVIDADEHARVAILLEVIRHLQASGVEHIALGDEASR